MEEVLNALHKVRDLSADLRKFGPKIASLYQSDDGTLSEHGISLLQVKAATLLRYNRNLIRLAQLKVKGESIEPIAEKLVADWVALERIRPLEKKIRHQIDALLTSVAAQAAGKESEADKFRKRKSGALFGDEEDNGNKGDGEEHEAEVDEEEARKMAMTEVVYDAEGDRKAAKELKERAKKQARMIRGEGVREMLAEVQGLPDEVRDDDFGGVRRNAVFKALLREDEKRMKYEEEHMTRLSVSKKDKKRRRDIERAMEGPGLDGMDQFSGLMAVADRVMSYGQNKQDATKAPIHSREEEELKVDQLDEMSQNVGNKRRKSTPKSGKKRGRR